MHERYATLLLVVHLKMHQNFVQYTHIFMSYFVNITQYEFTVVNLSAGEMGNI